MRITLGVLSVMWTFILVIVTVPNVIYHKHSYQTPVPVRMLYFYTYTFLILRDNCLMQLWCWIGKDYLEWRLLGEYVWLWLALFFSIATYTALYLWMRGNLVLGKQGFWRCSFRRVREGEGEADETTLDLRRHSFVMLAYVSGYPFNE